MFLVVFLENWLSPNCKLLLVALRGKGFEQDFVNYLEEHLPQKSKNVSSLLLNLLNRRCK